MARSLQNLLNAPELQIPAAYTSLQGRCKTVAMHDIAACRVSAWQAYVCLFHRLEVPITRARGHRWRSASCSPLLYRRARVLGVERFLTGRGMQRFKLGGGLATVP